MDDIERTTEQPTGQVYIRLAGTMDRLQAGMLAAKLAKRLKADTQVCDSGSGELIGEHAARRRKADPKAPRGPDWSSKSGQTVTLMLRPDGATMDEIRDVTGWSFGAKYAASLERSFKVRISTHPATSRTKRTWHAEPVTVTAQGDASPPAPDPLADDDTNVVRFLFDAAD